MASDKLKGLFYLLTFFPRDIQLTGPVFSVFRIINPGEGIPDSSTVVILCLQVLDHVQAVFLFSEFKLEKGMNALGETKINIGVDENLLLSHD
jgi:hypothetical protein